MTASKTLGEVSFYKNGWKSRGIKPEWERCSMGIKNTEEAFPVWMGFLRGPVKECVAWFDEDGSVRALVADSEERRITVRINKRGGWRLQTESRQAAKEAGL